LLRIGQPVVLLLLDRGQIRVIFDLITHALHRSLLVQSVTEVLPAHGSLAEVALAQDLVHHGGLPRAHCIQETLLLALVHVDGSYSLFESGEAQILAGVSIRSHVIPRSHTLEHPLVAFIVGALVHKGLG